jgi:hypothetical protein
MAFNTEAVELAICRPHFDRYLPVQVMCEHHDEHGSERCELPYCGRQATHLVYLEKLPSGAYRLRRKFGA